MGKMRTKKGGRSLFGGSAQHLLDGQRGLSWVVAGVCDSVAGDVGGVVADACPVAVAGGVSRFHLTILWLTAPLVTPTCLAISVGRVPVAHNALACIRRSSCMAIGCNS